MANDPKQGTIDALGQVQCTLSDVLFMAAMTQRSALTCRNASEGGVGATYVAMSSGMVTVRSTANLAAHLSAKNALPRSWTMGTHSHEFTAINDAKNACEHGA